MDLYFKWNKREKIKKKYFKMSQVAAQAAIKTLFDLYWKVKPETRPVVMDKLAKIGNYELTLAYLSNQWKDVSGDITQIPQGLNFLALYTMAIKEKLTLHLSNMIFAIYITIVKQNPIPISYENYSKFISIIFSILKLKNQQHVLRQLSQLDPQTAMYPMAHYVLYFNENINEFLTQLLEALKKITSHAAQSTWNETLCILLKAKARDGFDKLAIFSAVDLALAKLGTIDSKVNLLSAAHKFFSLNEMSQILRMHFDVLLEKITPKISNSVLTKLLSLANVFYDVSNSKSDAALLVFKHLFINFTDTKPLIDNFSTFCNKLKSEEIDLIFGTFNDNTAYVHPLLFMASFYPTPKTFPILVADVLPQYRDLQYKYLVHHAKSGKFDLNSIIFLFSLLNASDYNIIEDLLKNDKSNFIINMIRYLQRSTDREKILAITKILINFGTFPILQLSEITDCIASLIAAYFTQKITENEITILFNYLDLCNKGVKGDFTVQKNEKQTYPIYIKEFFENRKEWKNSIHECALSRIRKADKNVSVTMIAVAQDATAFQQGVAFTKDDANLLTAYLTAASLNFSSTVLEYVSNNAVKRSGMLGGFLTSKIVDKEILRVALYCFQTIIPFISVSDLLLNIITIMYTENINNNNDFTTLLNVTKLICEKIIEKQDFTTIIDKLCDNYQRADEKIVESTLIALMKINPQIIAKLADKICNTWISILTSPSTPIKQNSDFEKTFLKAEYFSITSKLLIDALIKQMIEKPKSENIFLSFKRSVAIGNVEKNIISENMYIFIGNCMNPSKEIRDFSLEMIKSYVNVSSRIYEISESDENLDKNIPFFNELIVRLAFDLDELFSIAKKLSQVTNEPNYEATLYFFSTTKHSGKEALINHGTDLMAFLSSPISKYPLNLKYMEQIVLNLFETHPKLLMQLFLTSPKYKPSENLYSLIATSQSKSFVTTFFEIASSIHDSYLTMQFVHRLTKFFYFALDSRLILCEPRCIEIFIVIVTATNQLSNDDTIDTISEQKTLINKIANILFRTTPSDELHLKSGESGYMSTIGNVTKLISKLSANEHASVVSLMTKYSKTPYYFMNTAFVVWTFALLPSAEASKFLDNVTTVLSDKRLTKSNHVNLLKVLSSKLTPEMVSKLPSSSVKSLYNSFIIAGSSLDKKNYEKLSKGFMIIYNTIDSDTFVADINSIIDIVRSVIQFKPEVLWEENFINFTTRFVKLCPKLNFVVTFTDAFVLLCQKLFIDRQIALKLMKCIYGDEFDYKDVFSAAAAGINVKYLAAARAGFNAASYLKNVTVEDLTILGALIVPLTTFECDKKEVIDNYSKFLSRIAMNSSEDLAMPAITLLAEMVSQ